MAKLKITLTKSTIGRLENQKANVKALGLSKIGSSAVHEDTPAVRGKLAKVSHLVRVEEVDE